MRKLVFTVLLASSFTGVFAQKLDDVREKLKKEKYGEAKEKIDKTLADAKNQSNSEAWYLKAQTYYGLSKSDPSALVSAFDALKRYYELEGAKPENARYINALADNNHGTLVNVYLGYTNAGRDNFRDKKFDSAIPFLKTAMEGYTLLNKMGLVPSSLDTMNVMIVGVAAKEAKMDDEAAAMYGRIIDANITDTLYVEAYTFMVQHYLNTKKDTSMALEYLAKGSNAMPRYSDYWVQLELNAMGSDDEKNLARYEELSGKYPDNYTIALNRGITLYNYTFFGDEKNKTAANEEKTFDVLNKTTQLDPNSKFAWYLLSQAHFNQVLALQSQLDAVRGTAAADVAKRKDINAKLDAKFEQMFEPTMKAYNLYLAEEATLKGRDKQEFKNTMNLLVDYHNRKKENDKVSFYENKIKALK